MSVRLDAAVKQAGAARSQSASAEKTVEQLEGEFFAQTRKLGTLQSRVAKVGKEVAELKKDVRVHPKKYGPALKEMEKKLAGLQSALDGQYATHKGAAEKLIASRAALEQAQAGALSSAKQANAVAKDERVVAPFSDAHFSDSVLDASSLSLARQRQLLGSASPHSGAEALAHDVKKVKQAMTGGTEAAAKTLDYALTATDPQNQAKLLAQLGPELKSLAAAAAKDPATGQAYLEALRLAHPEARTAMLKAVAGELKGELWQTGFGKALAERQKSGAMFEASAELIGHFEQLGKTRESGSLRGLTVDQLEPLRKDFEAKAKTGQRLRGELALLNDGFGPLMSEPQRKAAIDAFKAEHRKEFDAVDEASSKLAGALDLMKQVADPKTGSDERWAYQGNTRFQKEMTSLAKVLPELQNTPEGAKKVIEALNAQRKGDAATWIDGAVDLTKNSKELSSGVAKVVTSGIGQLAMTGEVTAKDGLVRLLDRNAGVLGIDRKQIDSLRDAFIDATGSDESTAKLKKAFTDIESGNFGTSDVAKNSLKVIGLGLSMYGVAKGVKDWGNGDALAHFKTVVESAKLSVETATFAVEILGRDGAVKALSKVGGGLSVVGGVLDVIGGIDGIRNGNVGEGAADLMTGAGGVLMGLASVSSSVPGGQLIGATLAVAGLVTKVVVGSRKEAAAERASEKDARIYLESGGVPPKLAKALANVRRTDHGNVGQAIMQLAPQLGLTKDQFFQKLLQLPADKLAKFADMALDLRPNAEGKIPTRSLGFQAGKFQVDAPEIKKVVWETKGGAPPINYFPQSLETGAAWTKQLFTENQIPI